jgi:hypothetical protein
VKGKIVAFFGGAPESFPGEERAHFSSPASKAEIAMKKGAVGYITLESPITAKTRPFAMAAIRRAPALHLGRGGRHRPYRHAATPGLGMLSARAPPSCSKARRRPGRRSGRQAEVDGATFKPRPAARHAHLYA